MSTEFKYLLFALIILLVWYMLSLAINRHKINYEIRRRDFEEGRKEKELQKEQSKHSKVTLDNPILLAWLNDYFIVFDGNQGAGKTILANLYAHFCYYHELELIKKYHRQHEYLYPEYLEKLNTLEEKKLLPIHSNIELVDRRTGFRSQANWRRVLEQKDPTTPRIGFVFIDELRREFPKNLVFETRKKDSDPELKDVEDSGKFIRQKLKVHMAGTEQTQSNFWKGLRDAGQTMVHCEETIVSKTRFGKFLLGVGNFFMTILPTFCTLNCFDEVHKNIFFCDKFKTFFKLLLPAYFTYPFRYYYNKRAFYNWVSEKFTTYKTFFEYKGKHYWLQYTNNDLFAYDTTFFGKEYDEKMAENEKIKRLKYKEQSIC